MTKTDQERFIAEARAKWVIRGDDQAMRSIDPYTSRMVELTRRAKKLLAIIDAGGPTGRRYQAARALEQVP